MTCKLPILMSQLKRNFIVTFLTACLVLLANSVAAEDNPLTQQLERIKQQTGVGAVAYALVENNKIMAIGGIGTYGNNNARPVTETSLFRIGSISKTFYFTCCYAPARAG